MAPAKRRLELTRGDDWTRNIEVISSTTNEPIDITGYTARMQIREVVGSADTLVSLSSPGDITIGGANGVLTIQITSAVSTLFTPGPYVYDLEVTDTGALAVTYMAGDFIVVDQVTR